MTDIFVNYRSSDQSLAALIIDQELTKRLGPGRIFRDNRSIELGTHFPPEIERALQDCRVLIAVIGTGWFVTDEHGARRIDDPLDFVRMEIATALGRNIRVVPVLVGAATLPTADQLPPDIAGLATRQYLTLRMRDADHDARRLADELLGIVGAPDLAAEAPSAQTAVANNFHGPVDARGAVFGFGSPK